MRHEDIISDYVEQLRRESLAHWRQAIGRRGVPAAWPGLVQESGTPVRALQHQARALGGGYFGERLDPDTGKPASSTVFQTRLSKVFVGPPNAGKTTRAIIPGALQDLAGGANVVLVTPQPKTVDDIYPAAQRLAANGAVTVLDFGGRVISPDSKRLTAWDPTRGCEDPEAARAFARTLAGPDSAIAADLGEGRGAGYWLQVPEGVIAAAAHLTAVERIAKEQSLIRRGMDPEQARAMSLSPTGLSGIGRVFDYLRRPAEADPARVGTPFEGLSKSLSPHLSPKQQRDLADFPAKLAEMAQIARDAAYHACQFPPALQRLAHTRAVLEMQGAPVDLDIAGVELEELGQIIDQIAGRESNPLDQLTRAIKHDIPPNEQRVLSPRPTDTEISPQDVIAGEGGLYVVCYDPTVGPGVAAGWFGKEVVDQAFRASSALQAEALMGGTTQFPGVAAWIDEGGALKYMDFDKSLTEGRQHGIAVNVSATSVPHLMEEIGEDRARKILASAPIKVEFAPEHDTAVELSDAFGTRRELDITRTQQSIGAGYTWQENHKEVPRVKVDRLLNLGPGEVVVTDSSDADHRVSIVQTAPFYEHDNPVGAAHAQIAAEGSPGVPWEEFRPDVHARLRGQSAPEDAVEGPPEAGSLRKMPETIGDAAPGPDPATTFRPDRDLAEPEEVPAPPAPTRPTLLNDL